MTVHITPKSSNSKVGRLMVTTSAKQSCPTTCVHYNTTCYASSGFHLNQHWNKVSTGERGGTWDDLTNKVKTLKAGTMYRHNQAGDFFYDTDEQGRELINLTMLKGLVDANKSSGAKGYTYTHHKLDYIHNLEAVKYANTNGFTVNGSTESMTQADEVCNLGIPAVTIIPETHEQIEKFKSVDPSDGKTKELFKVKGKITTPQGRRVVVCPAQQAHPNKCETCKLCTHSKRDYVIAFVAHGNQKKKLNAKLSTIAHKKEA